MAKATVVVCAVLATVACKRAVSTVKQVPGGQTYGTVAAQQGVPLLVCSTPTDGPNGAADAYYNVNVGKPAGGTGDEYLVTINRTVTGQTDAPLIQKWLGKDLKNESGRFAPKEAAVAAANANGQSGATADQAAADPAQTAGSGASYLSYTAGVALEPAVGAPPAPPVYTTKGELAYDGKKVPLTCLLSNSGFAAPTGDSSATGQAAAVQPAASAAQAASGGGAPPPGAAETAPVDPTL